MFEDPLQFGDLLMRKRARLEALAKSLAADSSDVGVAVRCTLCDAWLSRESILTETALDRHLDEALSIRLRTPVMACRDRAAICSRPQGELDDSEPRALSGQVESTWPDKKGSKLIVWLNSR
jgi:hypothetical protein